LPASGGKLTIKNLSDYSGNKTDFSIIVEPKYDLEKPEYVSYKIDDKQKKIIIEFSEDIMKNVNNYELVNADGDDVAISIDYDKNDKNEDVKNKIVITKANENAFDSGKYKLTIDGVKDITPIRNEIDKITVTIEVDDQKAPVIEEVVEDTTIDDETGKSKNALYIRFNEDVDYDSATDYNNYAFVLAGKSTIYDLDKDFADIDLLSDEKTVCISFDLPRENVSLESQKEGEDYVFVYSIVKIQVNSVEDTSGNAMSRYAIDSDDEAKWLYKDNSLRPVVLSAAVTGENTITVKIRNKINDKTLTPSDFALEAYDAEDKRYVVEAYDAEYNSDDNEIKLSINQDLAANATYKGGKIALSLVDSDDVNTVNAFEQKLYLAGSITVADSYNPTISSVVKAVYNKEHGNYAEIEVTEELALEKGELRDGIAKQFSVKVGDDTVDAMISYEGPSLDKDDKDTDEDETKARFVVVIIGDKAKDDLYGKTIRVSFIPLADSKQNRDDTLIITDKAGNALKEKRDMTKKYTK
jgi:hypothetical protein